MIRRMLISSVMLTLVVAVALGLAYPFAITGIGKVVFPYRSNGSFIVRNGQIVLAGYGQTDAQDWREDNTRASHPT